MRGWLRGWYRCPIPKKERQWVPILEWINEQRKDGMLVIIKYDHFWFENHSDFMLYLMRWELE